jgi:hypothetical protein
MKPTQQKKIDQAPRLIKDRRFLFRAGKKMDELGLVREVRNRLIVFLAALTAIINDRRRRVSVLTTGSSGGGKSRVIETPLKLFPQEWVIRRASFTTEALAYNQESMDGKIFYVTEYDGGGSSKYNLRILQSEGELAREFTVGRKTDVTQRLGTPVVLTATTKEKILQDDATRFVTIAIDETAEQNVAVFKSELGMKADSGEPPEEVWQEATQLMKDGYEPFVFPSWFEYVAEQLPSDMVRTRRDWKRFLGLIEAIAICNPDSRRDGKITFADYAIAFRLLESAFAATTYAINENELWVQRAVERLRKESGQAVTISQVREYLEWNQSMTYKFVKAAAEHKLITYEPGTKEKNVKRLLPGAKTTSRFLPSPRRLIQDVKELGPSLEYVDPITGEVKTLVRGRGAAA